ncbi:MAG: tRNA pseudouridine(38-40) synthase TruA [Flavobacteriales bacterium]|jgi:tRNA pseudouridine38-40 synthase|nr:tRNA pseudouridine(38-40) synthase TruA [Flavobacteriales bacterium]
MRFFIDISYNGSNYHGWQIQPNADTVQHHINNALTTILNIKIEVVGAGRTDAGVHAKNFIAHFDIDKSFDKKKVILKMNGFLNNDIAINNIYSVANDTHARFSALSRTYEYRISKIKNPFNINALLLMRKLNIMHMNLACQYIIGSKDFSSFAKLHSDNYTNNCNISFAEWDEIGNDIVFTIKSDRFLRNMVRAIVGTMIEIGDGKISSEDIREVVAKKNRSLAGYSVPANGLTLINIEYSKEILNGTK